MLNDIQRRHDSVVGYWKSGLSVDMDDPDGFSGFYTGPGWGDDDDDAGWWRKKERGRHDAFPLSYPIEHNGGKICDVGMP